MTLRGFIEQLKETGELTKITKPVSVEYEMAGIIAANGENQSSLRTLKNQRFRRKN